MPVLLTKIEGKGNGIKTGACSYALSLAGLG